MRFRITYTIGGRTDSTVVDYDGVREEAYEIYDDPGIAFYDAAPGEGVSIVRVDDDEPLSEPPE